jgi:predicted nucleotide-binding protein
MDNSVQQVANNVTNNTKTMVNRERVFLLTGLEEIGKKVEK